jgi:hypothetical protein
MDLAMILLVKKLKQKIKKYQTKNKFNFIT